MQSSLIPISIQSTWPSLSAIFKCPFASKWQVLVRAVLLLNHCQGQIFIYWKCSHKWHESDGLTVGIIKPGKPNGELPIIPFSLVDAIKLISMIRILLSRLMLHIFNLRPVPKPSIYNEIIGIKGTLSASVVFFFSSNTLIINPQWYRQGNQYFSLFKFVKYKGYR